MNTDDKTDDRKDDRAELEEHFPSHVHWHHLPLYEEGKQEKIYTSSGLRKSTATAWHSYGHLTMSTIFYHELLALSSSFFLLQVRFLFSDGHEPQKTQKRAQKEDLAALR